MNSSQALFHSRMTATYLLSHFSPSSSSAALAASASAVSACVAESEVRRWWLVTPGITQEHERGHLGPAEGCPSTPWSAAYMIAGGKEAEALVADRLAAAGAVLEDVPDLQRETVELLELATETRPTSRARQARQVRPVRT